MAKQKSEIEKNALTVESPRLTVMPRVLKADTFLVLADAAKELEDEFANIYLAAPGAPGGGLAIQPPFFPRQLKEWVKHNNILNQCVQAMEVNIDGTGHEFVPADDEKQIDPKEEQAATAFFNEPYPGTTFISARRLLRQDMESIGWGAFEILRTMDQSIVGFRHIEGQTLRMVYLNKPQMIQRTITRNGQEVNIQALERPRRWIQVINGGAGEQNRQFFKEFGTPLNLNRRTGEWETPENPVALADQATELLVFGVDRDSQGPYYVPRWINQLPSVVGSRKAEEQNLEFFDSGGMPPAIIFLQGGAMVGKSAQELRTYLSAQNRRKGRAVVVELQSNSGSVDSTSTVSARVERFGAQNAGDGMFSKYDQQTEDHVRVGFRLPPLFLGKATDYSYATAVTAYQVAEAQVFQPERTEFDDKINMTLIKAMGWKTLKIKSKPITIKSVEETFQGLTLVDGKVADEGFVDEVNKVLGTDLKYQAPPPQPTPLVGNVDPHTGLPYKTPVDPVDAAKVGLKPPPGDQTPVDQKTGKYGPGSEAPNANPGNEPPAPPGASAKSKKPGMGSQPRGPSPIRFSEGPLKLVKLAKAAAEAEGLIKPLRPYKPEQIEAIKAQVDGLSGDDRQQFLQFLGQFTQGRDHHAHAH